MHIEFIIIILKKNMGNGEFQVSDQVKQEWIQVHGSNKRILYNKVTQDEFQFFTLSKVNYKYNISQIMERSIYPLPNTPHVIILDDRAKQISILVQNKSYGLKDRLNQISLVFQLLKITREIVSTLNSLFQRFGSFRISENMICFSKSEKMMMWINENFSKNEIELRLGPCQYPQQRMLLNVLRIIEQNSSLKLDNNLFMNPPTTFSLFLSKIDQIINQQRRILHNKKTNHSSKQLHTIRFQPRSQIKQLNLHEQKQFQQFKVKKGQEIKDKYKVPAFVRNAKFTKNKINNKQQLSKNISSRKDKNQINLGRIKSLNCSPQDKEVRSKLRDTYKISGNETLFLSSSGNLGSLLFSKQSTKSKSKSNKNPEVTNPNKLFIPPIKNLKVKQQFLCTESSLQTQQDKRVDKIGDMTFRDPSLSYSTSLGQLNSYCKSMSQSRELGDISILSPIKLNDTDEKSSIIIHQTKKQSVFAGGYIKIYEQFSKILF